MKSELGEYFRIEARELCEDLTRGLLDLEKEPASSERLASCFRFAHTLKGAAGMARKLEIGELAHAIEDTLAGYRATGEPMERAHVSDLLAIVDAIRLEVDEPARAEDAAAKARPAGEERLETVRVDISAMETLSDDLSEIGVKLFSLRTGKGALAQDEEAIEALERIERDVERARDVAASLRLVPVSVIFAHLELAAREAAEALGKGITFEVEGGGARIEGQILSAVRDALLHVVRNAVDHGIEAEADRIAAGKNRRGNIRLEVERKARRVVFHVHDDGRGIDHEAVGRAAAGAARAGELAAADTMALIFQPGVSTRESVTGVSGRGVGLDVVRAIVETLRGAVAVHSVAGRGTTMSLDVPISLTSMHVLAVAMAKETALIPLDGVCAARWVNPADMIEGPDGPCLLHEDRVLPFTPLDRVLHWKTTEATELRRTAVIVRADDRRAAFGVDRLLGILDVMVKPLPVLAGTPLGVLGASFDSRGDPLLVLDPRGLLDAKVDARGPTLASPPPRKNLPILIIDDSLTTRMLEQSILSSAGYEVELSASAEEGLRMAERRHFGLFIVDVEMPGMNGLEFTARTRANPAFSAIPVVLVTSLGSLHDRRRGMEAGAAAYIVKSEFEPTRFVEKVAELLGAS